MLRQVDLSIEVRNTLVKFLGVWPKCHPPLGWAAGKWLSSAIVPQCSGHCSLCQGASFALQGRWDFLSLAPSTLGTYPDSHTGPTCMEFTQRKKNRKAVTHQSHTLSSSPEATYSLFLLLREKERFPWTSMGLFWGLREGASPRVLTASSPSLANKWPPPLLHSHFSLKLSPSSHPAYLQQLEEAPQTYQQEIQPKSTS